LAPTRRDSQVAVLQRQRFFFNLGAIGAAVLLIVASLAFGPEAGKGVGLGIGISGALGSLWFIAGAVHERHFDGHPEVSMMRRSVGLWTLLAAGLTAVAVWEAVQSSVFPPDPAKWLTLANGVLVCTIACAGLVAHELCSERVVHFLQVTERPSERDGLTDY
jgi:hypothetical protein